MITKIRTVRGAKEEEEEATSFFTIQSNVDMSK